MVERLFQGMDQYLPVEVWTTARPLVRVLLKFSLVPFHQELQGVGADWLYLFRAVYQTPQVRLAPDAGLPTLDVFFGGVAGPPLRCRMCLFEAPAQGNLHLGIILG